MKNVNKERLNIIQSLRLTEALGNFNPQTMASTDLKKRVSEKLDNGQLITLASIIDVIGECNTIKNTDSKAFEFYETLTERLNENFKSKVVFVYEEILAMRQSNLTEQLLGKLDELLGKDSEEIKESIRSGALVAFRSYEPIQFLTESVKRVTENTEEVDVFIAKRPVSFFEHQGDDTFIRIGNQVLCVNENNVSFATSPNTKFTYITSVMESMQWDSEKHEFKSEYSGLGEFTVNENSIIRKNDDVEKIYEDKSALIKDMNMLVESMGNNTFDRREKQYRKQFIDSLLAIKENWSNIAILDSFVVVENRQNKEQFTMFVYEGNTFVGILKSNRYPNNFTKVKDISEGLMLLKKRSGYNAQQFFLEHVEKFNTITGQNTEKAVAYREVLEKLDAKENEIRSKISEERGKDNPSQAKIAKLNEVLSSVCALIVEQNNNLRLIIG